MRRWLRNFAGAAVFVLVLAGVSQAKTVTLAWDESPETTVVGYRIYYQAGSSVAPLSGTGAVEGASPVDVGLQLSATLSGLADAQTHYFAVTAYDAAGNESPYSNQVSSPPVPVNRPPVLAAIGSRSVAEGETLTFTVTAGDPDGNPLSYNTGTLPAGAAFNSGTGVFTWTPVRGQAGSYTLVFAVSDGWTADGEVVTVDVSPAVVDVPYGLSLSPDDIGLPGIERGDGGSDGDNLVNGLPKGDLDFVFGVILRDNPNNLPLTPRLYLNGHGYDMVLTSGDVGTGALYTFTTRLGPLAPCRYHFEVRDQQGNLLWSIPESGDLNGPRIELLNGANFVGIPKDIAAARLGSVAALGTASSYRWILDGEGQVVYAPVDNGAFVTPGEGYVVYRGTASTLPELAEYGEVPGPTASLPLHGGWNIIANPYLGHQTLSQVRLRQEGGATVGWEEAVSLNWVFNALYQYVGQDWGNTYLDESLTPATDPILIPGIGYLVYVNPLAAVIAIEIPRLL
ncbi:hypothetical protein DSOUD_1405 [Desulfuromonas soudanensis]|uniref:Fibronectin type-III domain-containing protein n=1 Tax=Desulfuromonas soudanensis TaxID=1603606 RepID=A0A0M4D0Q6_9BACT|nr:Ig domain-containing protein [Desulfuromonas soudanensis]ALC16184.1 hypothetical protein DSOUD_1405 [Desulfuromonas soudanensis]